MRFTEVGQQLRAYRLESGQRAEEIAAQLGVSRAALYRYEKGDVIKLDTIQRLAELLKISPLSLLGIATEYYSRPIAYFERIRQIEETADQLLMLDGPLCYLTTSEAFDGALSVALTETGAAASDVEARGQIASILAGRKQAYAQRRPNIICMIPSGAVQRLLTLGVAPTLAVSERTRRHLRQVAAAEVQALIGLIEAEPMGLQFGILTAYEQAGNFVLVRARDRATLAVNPFRADLQTGAAGVAMVTAADEAIAAHQRIAEAQWREALKGAAGATHLRTLLAEHAAR